jgi:hypothetical protein
VSPSRVDRWLAEQRSPAEVACLLARDRFWQDETLRLVGTHPDFPDVAMLLDLEEELAHALVLALSRVPTPRRPALAERFYEQRSRERGGRIATDARLRLQAAAGVALLVVELAADVLRNERVVDLLQGLAQGDDLTRTPTPALDELRRAVARVRYSIELEDPADPRAAAAHAIVEVLDPASEVVSLQAVLARAAWAAVESWEPRRTLEFLLDCERIVARLGEPADA